MVGDRLWIPCTCCVFLVRCRFSGFAMKDLPVDNSQRRVTEASSIRKATLRYLLSRPAARLTPFGIAWLLLPNSESIGEVWSWASGLPR